MLGVTVIIVDICRVRPGIRLFSLDITYISSFDPHPCYCYFTDEVMKAQRGWWLPKDSIAGKCGCRDLAPSPTRAPHFRAALSQAWCWRHVQGVEGAGKSLSVLSIELSHQDSHWALPENMPIIVPLWRSPSPAPNLPSYMLKQKLETLL